MELLEISNPYYIIEDKDKDQPWARKLYFSYQKAKEMSRPDPIVVELGYWRMTDKQGVKKKFLCGLNLAALSSKQELVDLQEHLPDLLKAHDAKEAYDLGKSLIPHVFRKAYRTYNVKNIASRPLFGRLYALKTTKQDVEKAKELAAKDFEKGLVGKEWNKLSMREQDKYKEEALQQRGEDDVRRKERAKKERSEIDDYYDELNAQREKEEFDEPTELSPDQPEAEYPTYKPAPRVKRPKPAPAPAPKSMQPLNLGPEFDNPDALKNAEVGLPTIKPKLENDDESMPQ